MQNELRQKHISKIRCSDNANSCNTDKTVLHACDVKVKTRGILIFMNNCGVIVGYRELYGSESLTRVANLYLDLVDSIQSLIYFF